MWLYQQLSPCIHLGVELFYGVPIECSQHSAGRDSIHHAPVALQVFTGKVTIIIVFICLTKNMYRHIYEVNSYPKAMLTTFLMMVFDILALYGLIYPDIYIIIMIIKSHGIFSPMCILIFTQFLWLLSL